MSHAIYYTSAPEGLKRGTTGFCTVSTGRAMRGTGGRPPVRFLRFAFDAARTVATSSLDIPSERLVQAALSTVLADRTAIIIAHRLSTVEIADRVLVLRHGEIVEDGRPDVLVRGGGRYADLHRAWVESLA